MNPDAEGKSEGLTILGFVTRKSLKQSGMSSCTRNLRIGGHLAQRSVYNPSGSPIDRPGSMEVCPILLK
jgi:hypothetical protein